MPAEDPAAAPCPDCGYDMRSQLRDALPRCPECGRDFTAVTILHASAYRPDSRWKYVNGAGLTIALIAVMVASAGPHWVAILVLAGASFPFVRVWASFRGEGTGWAARTWVVLSIGAFVMGFVALGGCACGAFMGGP